MAKKSNTDGIEYTNTPLSYIGATSGFPYGSAHGNHIGVDLDAAAQNTWYTIADAGDDVINGELNNVTHDLNGQLTVAKAGVYLVIFSVSYEADAANVHTEIGVEVDGAAPAADSPLAHTTTKFLGQEQQSTGSGIIALTAGQTIQLAIRTTDVGAPDFFIDNIRLNCLQIGAA